MVPYVIADIGTTLKFKMLVAENKVMSNMTCLWEDVQSEIEMCLTTAPRNLCSDTRWAKGELCLVPFTNKLTWAAQGSSKESLLLRGDSLLVKGVTVTCGDGNIFCIFLTRPSMNVVHHDTTDSNPEKAQFIVPFLGCKSNHRRHGREHGHDRAQGAGHDRASAQKYHGD